MRFSNTVTANLLLLLSLNHCEGDATTATAGSQQQQQQKAAFLRSTTRRSLAIAGCPGGDGEDFSVSFDGKCTYTKVRDAVYAKRDTSTCSESRDAIMVSLTGASTVAEAANIVNEQLCREAYTINAEATFDFADITQKGTQFDNEYYAGGTYLNYEIQNDAGEHELKTDAARVNRVYKDQAQHKVIDLPSYLTSFDPDQDGCDINAAFCCWVQDRQANDNNGNCNTPYESQCIDRDPGDNANFCYTDHSRSGIDVNGGFSVFGNVLNGKENIEGAVHCHGLAWAQDETDTSAVYKGNNLFYVSLYDHMHQRGYVRNAPGSPMCGCAENMAVVTRADCTEISADETFRFDYDASTSTLKGALSKVRDLDFNACQGANNKNNDLEAYYKRLVNEGKQPASNLAILQKTLVGTQAGKCNQAIVDFMSTKGIVRSSNANSAGVSAAEKDEIVDPDYLFEESSNVGEGNMMPKVPGEGKDVFDDEETIETNTIDSDDDKDYEDDEPQITMVDPLDEETEDLDDSDDDEEFEAKQAGEKCALDGECMSGECQKGACTKSSEPEEPQPDPIGLDPIVSPPEGDKEKPKEEPVPVTSPSPGDKDQQANKDVVAEEGESILFEDFEGENVFTDYILTANRVDSTFGYGDSTSKGVSIKKTQSLRTSKWVNISQCKKMKFKFFAFPKGYDGMGEGFSLETKLRYKIKGGGWVVNSWTVDGEWKAPLDFLDQWKQLESPEFNVEENINYVETERITMKFLIRSNGSNSSKEVFIDDLNVICQD